MGIEGKCTMSRTDRRVSRCLKTGAFSLALVLCAQVALSQPAAAATNRILVIGDSHTCQSFGRDLDQSLRTLSRR